MSCAVHIMACTKAPKPGALDIVARCSALLPRITLAPQVCQVPAFKSGGCALYLIGRSRAPSKDKRARIGKAGPHFSSDEVSGGGDSSRAR
jgi:hypothetical protein